MVEMGNKDEPWGSAGALCTPYWVPFEVTVDILYEGQKQTTQQKQADVDKRRHTWVHRRGAEGILRRNANSISG